MTHDNLESEEESSEIANEQSITEGEVESSEIQDIIGPSEIWGSEIDQSSDSGLSDGGKQDTIKTSDWGTRDNKILRFAQRILGGLAIALILAGMIYSLNANNSNKIIWDFTSELVKTITLLVIGAYFSSNGNNRT